MNEQKTLSVLGSTGSIGRQTLDIAERKNIKVEFLALGKDVKTAEEQIRKHRPLFCAVCNEYAAKSLAVSVADTNTKILFGKDGIEEGLGLTKTDICINGIGGFDGLFPTLDALKYCKRVGLANKESLVAAGEIVLRHAKQTGAELIPVDSEHSTIFRCLAGEKPESVKKLILTCSGGAFFGKTKDELKNVTAADATLHPNWKMGKVITVNCATLINKGLEVIEASRLFGLPGEKIDVVIHRESIIHSLVELNDGSMKALLSTPDMRIPIQYAIEYPECTKSPCDALDLVKIGNLSFAEPDCKTFPLLSLARKTLDMGGVIPCVMNAANEIAVDAFLCGKICFCDIEGIVKEVTLNFKNIQSPTLDDICRANDDARRKTLDIINIMA